MNRLRKPRRRITGSTSLFCGRTIMPGIDFRQLRADITMAEVLDLLGFVIVRTPRRSGARPMSVP